MAKTVKIKKADNYAFNITSKDKNTNYVFVNEADAGVSSLYFNNIEGNDPAYIKDGNDLLIYIKFGGNTNYKLTVTRIKNYYLYCDTNNALVYVDNTSAYANAKSNNYTYITKSFTDSAFAENVFSNVGATTYNISNSKAKTNILDITGSDKYFVKGLSPDSAPVYVDDLDGNDYYEITNSKGLQIFDYKGNDKYTIKDCNQIISSDTVSDDSLKTDLWICDIAGNDSYNFDNVVVTNNVYCKTLDVSGNDKFTLNNTSYMYLEEKKGNDKYVANQSDHFLVCDYSGNDSYTITSSNFVTIEDAEDNYKHVKGNDKYTLASCSNVDIEDEQGNDKYKFSKCDNVDIEDGAGADNYAFEDTTTKLKILDKHSENDTYTITNAVNVDIDDRGGREKYKLTNVKGAKISDSDADGINGNDTMTVVDSNNIDISNKHGNVSYKFANTSNITIEDKTGKDTYSISGVYDKHTKATTFATNVTITDRAQHEDDNHNDTFNFNYVKGSGDLWTTYLASDNWTITEYGGSNTYNIKQSENIKIHSNNGNRKDTYNITSCKNVYLLDEGSNGKESGSSDTYSIQFAPNSLVKICDKGGENDKLSISGVNRKNVVIMSNYKNNGVGVSDEQQSLIIFDTKFQSYVQIENFYSSTDSGDYNTGLFGDGVIESIKAGGNINAASVDTVTKLNNIRSQMITFLGNGESVVDVLNSGNNARIQDLVTLCTNQA